MILRGSDEGPSPRLAKPQREPEIGEISAFLFDEDSVMMSILVLAAVRCWRAARDDDEPVQPRLCAELGAYRCEMLAPVFDSLMVFWEWALERPLAVGSCRPPSDDEYLLLELLITPDLAQTRLGRASEATVVFGCALRSTRIMMKLTIPKECRSDKRAPCTGQAASDSRLFARAKQTLAPETPH